MNPQPLPTRTTRWQRPFPDADSPLLHGRRPALVDSGFVGHAEETAARARAHAGPVDPVVNTHRHCDHVGGNALLRASGAAGAPEAEALARRPGGRPRRKRRLARCRWPARSAP
ncbi:MBL fold metallo-hydrolase [Streptomyces sp. NPDC057565]|uniref:MBL fold metallo-hydrolase n=1 Tax=Streptomyces sp. NPDC057565 TaxID=3346169 RepID=UPI003674234D